METTIQFITGNGTHVVHKDEREYVYTNDNERLHFIAFMLRLGYHYTGIYISDAGTTIIFY